MVRFTEAQNAGHWNQWVSGGRDLARVEMCVNIPPTKSIQLILFLFPAGPKAILPGALTASALCTLLQLAYNELGVSRLRYISRLKEESSMPKTPASSTTHSPIISSEASKSFSARILTTLGLQPLSDQEYLDKMKMTRETYLKRIAILEEQLEKEKAK
jgi:hypothetical protein